MEPDLRYASAGDMIRKAACVNNMQGQPSVEMLIDDKTHQRIEELAHKAHLEVCQRVDLRRDLASRLLLSDGPF
eukprot:5053990-Prorocentrum_lima.AAC.1